MIFINHKKVYDTKKQEDIICTQNQSYCIIQWRLIINYDSQYKNQTTCKIVELSNFLIYNNIQ